MSDLRQIFNAAIELGDFARRAAFVQSACGDDAALRGRLEDLLKSHDEAGGFLQSREDSSGPVFAELPSERIGRYKLLQKLGEGGYGVVYMAEQLEPVKRRVALKIIKLGMDTRSVIARFEAERQALALMDHPNIARVLDAGATETGRPYFVMELVRGIKITDYCDQNSLSMNERLRLFIQVCQAVQHAHQKGVIHRDLKPSNILVTSHDDGTPLPKVIDFGIAKATADLHLTDKTLFTRFEMFIGTPAYMSPEQAEFSANDVDTRTDIYALGVLVYELLTGQTPFDAENLQNVGLEAMRRTIREAEPPRPSTRVRAMLQVERTEVARRRQMEAPKLVSQLHGDLDWIVLKALEKDRTRRYETANGLALDIQRHLRNEPISARPPSLTYVLRKMVRRHRAAVLSAVGMVFLLVLGVVASSWQAIRASAAEKRQREMRAVAEANERMAQAARTEADGLAKQNQRQVVRMHVAAGHKLLDERDDFAALLHFVEALRLESDPAREAIHRRRLGTVLRSAPRLSQIWFHGGFVTDVGFSHDGARVLSGANDKTVRVWDTKTGQLAIPAIHLDGEMMGCRFSPDGSRVITLDEAKQLQIWDVGNGGLLATESQTAILFLHEMDFSPNGAWMVLPSSEGARILDTRTGKPVGPRLSADHAFTYPRFSPDGRRLTERGSPAGLHVWKLTTDPPSSVLLPQKSVRNSQLSPDNRHVAINTLRDLAVWDLDRGQKLWPEFQPGGDLFDVQFSPDGRLFATASWDGRARVFDTATGLPVGDSMKHRMGLAHANFSPDGGLLATASWDSTARLWNPKTGAPTSPALRHAGYVNLAIFSPDGAGLATSSQDQTVRLWELKSETWGRVSRCPAGVKLARFSPDGTRILAVAFDGTVKMWETATGREIFTGKLPGSGRGGMFSPDGKWVVVGDDTGFAQVWDAATGEPIGPPVRHTGRLRTVDFSPNGRHILTASADRTARVWDGVTGEAVGAVLKHNDQVKSAKFSPDGRIVATASDGGIAQIWDARTGQPLGQPIRHECGLWDIAFSPDGRRLVTAPTDTSQLARSAQIWDVATGRALGKPLAHIDGVLCCEFSPDGRYLATGSEDKSAFVWDANTGERLTPPLAHRSYIMDVEFSPDSRMILTVGSDGMARVWESATGEPVTPPMVHDGDCLTGNWSPDGLKVVTASTDGTVRLWDVSPNSRPVEELRREAEILSAHRLQENLGAVSLTTEEIQRRWQEAKR